MVSSYGYITIATLELYASGNYEAIDATYLGDTYVDAKITAAEEFLIGYLGVTFVAPVPAPISFATKDIAKRLIYRWMREKGMKLDKEKLLEADKPFITEDLEILLRIYKVKNVAPIKLHRMYTDVRSVSL